MAAQSKTPRARRAARTPAEVPAASVDAPAPPAVRQDPKGKLGALVELLRRAQGADISDMMAATGWQAHSVRGALAGALKHKHGLAISSQKAETGRIYRIAADLRGDADASALSEGDA